MNNKIRKRFFLFDKWFIIIVELHLFFKSKNFDLSILRNPLHANGDKIKRFNG